MKKTEEYQTPKFKYKISLPRDPSNIRFGLMLHGWSGNESSMWVFANQLDDDWLLVAPRAPYPIHSNAQSGFSWTDEGVDHWPQFKDFLSVVNDLNNDVRELTGNFSSVEIENFAVFGFSQGAAISFVYSMIHSDKVSKLGMLSGFIPADSEGFIKKPEKSDLKIFLGHGSLDEIVPVFNVQEANSLLKNAGYSPHLCISEAGHRLGSDCFKAFSKFMNQR